VALSWLDARRDRLGVLCPERWWICPFAVLCRSCGIPRGLRLRAWDGGEPISECRWPCWIVCWGPHGLVSDLPCPAVLAQVCSPRRGVEQAEVENGVEFIENHLLNTGSLAMVLLGDVPAPLGFLFVEAGLASRVVKKSPRPVRTR